MRSNVATHMLTFTKLKKTNMDTKPKTMKMDSNCEQRKKPRENANICIKITEMDKQTNECFSSSNDESKRNRQLVKPILKEYNLSIQKAGQMRKLSINIQIQPHNQTTST